MKCPNEACNSELFKVNIAWEHRIDELPGFLPVNVNCAKCGHMVKAYVINKDLREIAGQVKVLNTMVTELLEGKPQQQQPKKKSFLSKLLKDRQLGGTFDY